MVEIAINYLAVIAAALAGMAVGFIWYSGNVFGTAWLKLTGLKMPKNEKEMAAMQKKAMPAYLISLTGSLVMAYILSIIVDAFAAKTALNAIQVAVAVWLGFIATTMASNTAFLGKPWKLYFIDVFHSLAAIIVMALIVTLWA